MKKAYFENLDTLRFFAFLAVFFNHTVHHSQIEHFFSNNIFLKEIFLFICDGKEGVSFFFVLSGFLITYLLLLEKSQTGEISLRKFYTRRVLRIFPLYYAVILFGFVIYPLMKSQIGISTFQPHNWHYHVVFLSNFDLVNLYHNSSINTDILMLVINWSLSVEEQFYIVFPLLVFLLRKNLYPLLFAVVIVITLGFRYFNIGDGVSLNFHTLAVMSDLAVGASIAYGAMYLQIDKFFLRLSKRTIFIIYVFGFIWVIFDNVVITASEYRIFSRLTHTIFYAFMILEQNYSDNSLYKLGRLKFATAWGKYTYGLYLLHPIGMQICLILLVKYWGFDNQDFAYQQLIFTFVSFNATLILAYASYHLFEKHFLRLKARFSVLNQKS